MKSLKEVATMLHQAQFDGSVASVIGGLVVGVVMLFIGLFMIDAVYNATALNISHVGTPFMPLQANLIATTGTVFSVLGLVIIVVALATAIRSLQGME